VINHGLDLHVYLKSAKLIIGGKGFNQPMLGHAVVEYRGLIQLVEHSRIEILENKSTEVFESIIYKNDDIRQVDTEYPLSIPMPNPIIHMWKPLDENYEYKGETDPRIFFAIFYPETDKKPLNNIMNHIFDSLDKSTLESKKVEEMRNSMNETLFVENNELVDFKRRTFSIDDVVITRDQIESILINLDRMPMPTMPLVTPIVQRVKKQKRVNLLGEAVKRILMSQAGVQSDSIWQQLRKDIKNEIRIYDTDSVIKNMTSDVLVWTDKGENDKQVTYKSFKNKVSTIRKSLVSSTAS